MKPVFRDLAPEGPRVGVHFDGRALSLRAGSNLAAALLAEGVTPFRHSPVSGAPRTAYCMMGVCFDCLVVIDGVTRQACLTEAAEGMVIHRAGPEGQDA